MNNFFLTSIIAILSVLMLQSCDSTKTVLESVPADKLDNTYTVKIGETLNVELVSNPSTGFKWQLTSKIKPKVIKEIGNKYVANDKSNGMVGAGGVDTWSFLAKKEGTLFMNFKYIREGGKIDKEKYFKVIVTK